MPRKATFKPKYEEGRQRPWKIEIPASVSLSGTRERYFFETKNEATEEGRLKKIEIDNHGTKGSKLASPAVMEQANLAIAALAPYPGVTLNQVVQEWVTRQKARDASRVFSEAAAEFEQHLTVKKIKGRPVSDSYRRQVKYTFPRFPALHARMLADITARDIAQATEGMPPSAKNAFLRVLSAFFSWCAEPARGWMAANPAQNVTKESVGDGEVETFSADQCSRLLAACAEHDAELLPYHLFGLFAGIRPEELERMEWKHVDPEEKHIVLPPDVTKTKSRRVIVIEDTLSTWLQWFISRHGIHKGPVTPETNLRKRLRALRTAAKVTWIQDGMRHTYASNWLAQFNDEHKLRANLGHKSASELWDHYHKATTKRDAEKFWAIAPDKKVIKFRGKAA